MKLVTLDLHGLAPYALVISLTNATNSAAPPAQAEPAAAQIDAPQDDTVQSPPETPADGTVEVPEAGQQEEEPVEG